MDAIYARKRNVYDYGSVMVRKRESTVNVKLAANVRVGVEVLESRGSPSGC